MVDYTRTIRIIQEVSSENQQLVLKMILLEKLLKWDSL